MSWCEIVKPQKTRNGKRGAVVKLSQASQTPDALPMLTPIGFRSAAVAGVFGVKASSGGQNADDCIFGVAYDDDGELQAGETMIFSGHHKSPKAKIILRNDGGIEISAANDNATITIDENGNIEIIGGEITICGESVSITGEDTVEI